MNRRMNRVSLGLSSGQPSALEEERTTGDVHDEISARLNDRDLVVVSNRQPYSHEFEDGEVTTVPNAGGLTAALDPLMQELSGTWVAWGSGDADREVADGEGRVTLPPGDNAYELHRVWLDDDEVEGYYRGYSNRVLWPICHSDVSKVDARPSDWETYRDVNDTFAERTIAGSSDDAVIWFQDYHFATAPRTVREARPDAFLAHFWHIPWPTWDVFQVCPHREAVLGGLLANDLIGFHTDADCRKFLDCVESAGIGRVDRITRSVAHDGGRTYVRPFPIGIDAAQWEDLAATAEANRFRESFRADHETLGRHLALGVERLDYTKGIERRLDALAHLWETRPEQRGELTYVQKLSSSREDIPAYHRLRDRIEDRIETINDRFGTDDWKPVLYLTEHLSREELAGLYDEADLALVTPVRDGMNLVAKEFVAAQRDDPGTLLLSELAGASEELGSESVLVNPYDVGELADAIEESLSIPLDERRERMDRLQTEVRTNDVYAWLLAQFSTIERVQEQQSETDQPSTAGDPYL